MSYTHLSQEERYQIRWLRKGGWLLEAIAAELHRAASTAIEASTPAGLAKRPYLYF